MRCYFVTFDLFIHDGQIDANASLFKALYILAEWKKEAMGVVMLITGYPSCARIGIGKWEQLVLGEEQKKAAEVLYRIV
jgi:hypothetical protein